MGVFIKYMDLPKSCSDCSFCVQKFATDECDPCGDMCLAMVRTWDNDRMVNYYEDEDGEQHDFDIESCRHPDCPMRERKGMLQKVYKGQSGDAISRQAVKDLYYKNGYIDFRKVCELPPVTPQQARWILISERLPEEGEDVLTQARVKDDIKMLVSRRVDYNYWIGWGTRDIDIVAWMPLPQPYMAESEPQESEG